MNINDFCKGVDKVAETIDPKTALKIKTLIFIIYALLIRYPGNGGDGTPRDTARAVASWFVSVDTPSEDSQPEGLPTYSQNESESSLANTDFSKPYRKFYISNNVPYINRLNDGHSNQAESGWVERSIKEGVRKLERT